MSFASIQSHSRVVSPQAPQGITEIAERFDHSYISIGFPLAEREDGRLESRERHQPVACRRLAWPGPRVACCPAWPEPRVACCPAWPELGKPEADKPER